jgi:hypothetical protein
MARQRQGWEQLERGCGGVWRHVSSGWRVYHCGHPTALFPYYGEAPDGGDMLLPGGVWRPGGPKPNGYAFRLLAGAQQAVEEHVARLAGWGVPTGRVDQ